MKKVHILLIATAIMFTASCATDSSGPGPIDNTGSESGKGGSMARFCISGDFLFTVDNNSLNMFDVSKPENPEFLSSRTQTLDFGIETIFPMDSLLFIGSQSGMYIYKISKYGFPQYLSIAQHVTSCDPVVAQDNYAYVTLNSNNVGCGRTTNVLQIYDVTDIKKPDFVDQIPLNSPMGLGIDGDKLFVCDKGLKVFDITDRTSPEQMYDQHSAGAHDISDAYDVIPLNGLLILVASSGIYQFDYTGETLDFLSKIDVKRQN